ncbi:hypothetical protein GCM10015535_69220 [Streptomyces gelaticus]|uniref:Uncharacterized protein n=1 Tax=Streptomyces gelaticus TaxID=285446 RepID=A0ABQ2W989_9ACTN|nr:hypothetical protein [Streptomyces gelaticus]GGV97573.1 hypothetical protein GCM10015535_69220 [Streptomyces gelaticus]
MAINHLEHGTRVIGARRLPIATGAYDLRIVFPGWTLPGVVTAGAAQNLVKAQKIAPVGRSDTSPATATARSPG